MRRAIAIVEIGPRGVELGEPARNPYRHGASMHDKARQIVRLHGPRLATEPGDHIPALLTTSGPIFSRPVERATRREPRKGA